MDGLKLSVYDKAFRFRGGIGVPESVTATIGFNMVGSAEVTVAANHPRVSDLLADGARLVMEREEGAAFGFPPRPLISGPVRAVRGQGPEGEAKITVTIEDDLRLLWRVLGWQVPNAAISAQNTASYRTYTGSAESIIKAAVRENAVERLGLPITMAPSEGKGAQISGGIKFRMHPLADRLFPAVENAGVGVRVYQDGVGLRLSVYEPETYAKVLSEESGTVRSWSWASNAPTVTRVVGGGWGEGTARVFRPAVDSSLESRYGDVVEAFTDARNGETNAEIDQSTTETLFGGKPTNGLAVELAETPYFRYGTVEVGDRITVQAGGLTVTDVLRTATLTWNKDSGLNITPAVGEITDSAEAKTAKAIRKLWQGLTNLKVR